MIKIWKFEDCPSQFRELHTPRDSTTWVMEVPAPDRGDAELVLQLRWAHFADVTFHNFPNGDAVVFVTPAQMAATGTGD